MLPVFMYIEEDVREVEQVDTRGYRKKTSTNFAKKKNRELEKVKRVEINEEQTNIKSTMQYN